MASSEEKDRPLVVTDEDLQYLAGELTEEWRDVARHLKISEGTIFNKTTDNKENVKEAKYKILLSWKQREGQHATYEVLSEALSKTGRRDLITGSIAGSNRFQEVFLTGKKRQFLKQLKNKYKSLCGDVQPVPFLKDKHNIGDLYVESDINILEKGLKNKGRENWRKLKDYKAVFTDPQITSKRHIIVGEPGYGKSILALQMTRDWCQGTAPMETFEILILLRLRQFKSVPTIFSAIKRFLLPRDSKLTEDDIESILNSSSALILLDGYDEYPQRGVETDIEQIIRGDMFQEHVVVLKTRISCLPPHYENATNECFRLTGFNEGAREMLIQKITVGCSEEADKIRKFVKEDPVSADFCKIPLFFTMISYMISYMLTKKEDLQNLKTVTKLFEHIIDCIFTHNSLKETKAARPEDMYGSNLVEVAFKGLISDEQQISWDSNELVGKIGQDRYNECVCTGILIEEEEEYDFKTRKYKKETRFFHKLFAEWCAAHYFATLAGTSEVKFESLFSHSSSKLQNAPRPDGDTLQPKEAANSDQEHLSKCPYPGHLLHMYRFACGLSPDAAVKIIKYLGTKENFNHYTLLCITEFTDNREPTSNPESTSRNLDTIEETIKLLCTRDLRLSDDDSSLYQKSVIALLTFASRRKIPVNRLWINFFPEKDNNDNLIIKPSKLPLPVMKTSSLRLEITTDKPVKQEQVQTILQYLLKCEGSIKLLFRPCLLPRYITVTEAMSALSSRDVEISWMEYPWEPFRLNFNSGHWESKKDGKQMTDKKYKDMMELSVFLQLRSGFLRQIRQEEPSTSSE